MQNDDKAIVNLRSGAYKTIDLACADAISILKAYNLAVSAHRAARISLNLTIPSTPEYAHQVLIVKKLKKAELKAKRAAKIYLAEIKVQERARKIRLARYRQQYSWTSATLPYDPELHGGLKFRQHAVAERMRKARLARASVENLTKAVDKST